MHSSISSSNSIERVIPAQNWGKIAIFSITISLALTLGWELFWRGRGYTPTQNDNKDAWALIREKVEQSPTRTVLIGSSRMLFDFNLDAWNKKYAETPLQLATVGTNASIYLDHLANKSHFSGTLLVGITPPLFFVPEGMPVNLPTKNIQYYEHFGPAKRLSHFLGLILDHNLAFIEQEDLPLIKLLENLPIKNRTAAKVPPKLPPYFMEMDQDRQGMMTRRTENNTKFQSLIQNTWIPLFTPPPPPPIFTPEQFKRIFSDHVDQVLKKTKENISKIQSRGGKIILIRFPSTGKVRELENQFAPRQKFWDRIVNETNPDKAIHFEDYSQLKNFQCPEWSHLTRDDALLFTNEIIKLL